MDSAAGKRMLVVVAHPDDETFGCGSLLAHASSRGAEVVVCCATRGEAGEAAPGSGVGRGELAAVREAELRAAAAFLGVARVEVLSWRDSGMSGDPEPGTLVAAPLDDVVDAVASLVDEVRPDVVVTLDGSDGHRDHARIRDATVEAVRRSSWRPRRVYLSCLAQALMQRWAEHVRARHPDSEYLAIGRLGTREEDITTVLDTSEHEQRRWQAISLHASQESPFSVMPDDLRHAFLATDRLRRVVPLWEGGPVERDLFGGEDGDDSPAAPPVGDLARPGR